MTPVVPQGLHEGGRLTIYAEHQPEYTPIPVSKDANGLLMSEWEPTPEERALLATGGRVRLWIHTYNQPLQPLQMEVVPTINPHALLT
jgi:hypothetical protein